MDSNHLKHLYQQAMRDPDRGVVVSDRLSALTKEELNQLFDTAVEGDTMELGRLVEQRLLPAIEANLGKQMSQALARSAEGDS